MKNSSTTRSWTVSTDIGGETFTGRVTVDGRMICVVASNGVSKTTQIGGMGENLDSFARLLLSECVREGLALD